MFKMCHNASVQSCTFLVSVRDLKIYRCIGEYIVIFVARRRKLNLTSSYNRKLVIYSLYYFKRKQV